MYLLLLLLFQNFFIQETSVNNSVQPDNLSMRKLLSLSTDSVVGSSGSSSWGCSSVCSSVVEVEELPLKYFESEMERNKSPVSVNEIEVKSENTLPSLLLKNVETDPSNDKTVSMPALEVKEELGISNSWRIKGCNVYAESVRSKTTQGIWFSLPEIENSSIENISLSNCDATELKSDKFSSQVEDSNSSSHIIKSEKKMPEAESGIDGESIDKFQSLPRRQIQRVGAYRGSRLHSQVTSQVPDTSVNNSEEVDNNRREKYVAMSHEDTSSGAVHCFRDEFGAKVIF